MQILVSIITSGRQQSKTKIPMTNVVKIVRNRVFDCHLSPDWLQMVMENTVSSVLTTFVDC